MSQEFSSERKEFEKAWLELASFKGKFNHTLDQIDLKGLGWKVWQAAQQSHCMLDEIAGEKISSEMLEILVDKAKKYDEIKGLLK